MNADHPNAEPTCSLEQFKAWLERQTAKDEAVERRARCRVGMRRLVEAIYDENTGTFSMTEAASLADAFIRNGALLAGVKGRIATVRIAKRDFLVPRNFVAVEGDK